MPLPSNEKLVQLGEDLVAQFDAIFGFHPGFRPAHAKGILLTGRFTPSPEAASLTRAPHIMRDSTPITARFSNSTGLPDIPDNNPNANPRGLAVRFHLGEHVHTDIISHSAEGFPTRTGQEFLEFLRAAAATNASTPSPTPIELFLASHPAALAYVQTPKPSPSSFTREAFYSVTAFRFTNARGITRYGRYRILPQAGVDHLNATASEARDANFLFDELTERIARGPIRFDIVVQLAEENDAVNDATVGWPSNRRLVSFGSLVIDSKVPDSQDQEQRIIFDPIPRVEGIDASDDPLLELRAAVYLLSGRRRRQAQDAGRRAGA